MKTAQQTLTDKLTEIGYFPRSMTEKNQEILDIIQKFINISERELKTPIHTVEDQQFLGNIDTTLEKFSPPTSGFLFFDTGKADDSEPSMGTGATLGLGRPGEVFAIFFNGKRFSLGRGAVYTYYEMPGAITQQHWDRKLEYALLKSPPWLSSFQVIQEDALGTTEKKQ